MIGDTLFDITAISLGTLWVIGWVLLIFDFAAQKLFPSKSEQLELSFKKSGSIIWPIQKSLFFLLIALFLIRLTAGWLGWAEPLKGAF